MTGDDKTRREIAELTDTLRDNLDKIVQHGKRADAIVKNMLLHSREGSGEHRLVDANALVEESLNLAYHGARAEKQGFPEVRRGNRGSPRRVRSEVYGRRCPSLLRLPAGPRGRCRASRACRAGVGRRGERPPYRHVSALRRD